MLFLILLGLALPQFESGADRSRPPAPLQRLAPDATFEQRSKCADDRPRMAEEWNRPGQARRLGDLPPGRPELTVLRKVDGCAIPAIVREGLGAGSPAEEGRR